VAAAVIVGAGPYGEVYLAYLRDAGVDVRGFLDDTPAKQGQVIRGCPVLGTTDAIERLADLDVSDVYAPLGHNRPRARFLDRAAAAGLATPSFVHPRAVVAPEVAMGRAVYVLPGTILEPYVVLGDYALVAANVTVSHHTVLGRAVFLSSDVTTAAKMHVGDYAYVGLGATMVTDKCRLVGEDAVIGAGAVVLRDVAPREVVAGVPARTIRSLDPAP
jgi:sugar O-acyltransferase (sialic acid O-acetyltransferase NeuD family)